MHRRLALYEFCAKSLYTIGWEDTAAVENKAHQYLHSFWDLNTVQAFGILNDLVRTPVNEYIKDLGFFKANVNLSVPNEENWVHTHDKQVIVLYYANLEWKREWAGETLFFDEAGEEVVYASVYKPGRVIVFDGHQPHCIRTQTAKAPHYRFTVALCFHAQAK